MMFIIEHNKNKYVWFNKKLYTNFIHFIRLVSFDITHLFPNLKCDATSSILFVKDYFKVIILKWLFQSNYFKLGKYIKHQSIEEKK